MKIAKLFLLLSIISCSKMRAADGNVQAVKTEAVKTAVQERELAMYAYSTRLGEMKFVRADGKPGADARTITLNGKPLLAIKDEKDAQGSALSLMIEDLKPGSTEYEAKVPGQADKPKIRRMLVLLGPVANCVKQFIILDFTGKHAFVSERFGYNPGDASCLAFKRAKWGRKESEITLDGPLTYVYYTGGKVIGPI
jgi:hypothetical protein